MNYKEQQRKKATGLRDELFKDPGGGQFKKIERDFVLKEPALNIWPGIREDVISYFKRNNIQFWDSGNEPTGHLLSSQIACINHLYFVRQRCDIATSILKNIDSSVNTALKLGSDSDQGFVDFEVIGRQNYLGERLHTRGANSTSVDAVMLAELKNKKRKLFLIEWKYVESYSGPSKAEGESGKTRMKTYSSLLNKSDCPIKSCNPEGLFTEPYYQLMRQTLLAHEIIKSKEYGADSYLHIHIIPSSNSELKNVNTAEGKLTGRTLEETWKNVLVNPDLYLAIDPADLLKPVFNCPDCISLLSYLKNRYWES